MESLGRAESCALKCIAKKKILSLWLATALALTGCGGKDQDVENPTASVTPVQDDTNTGDNQHKYFNY